MKKTLIAIIGGLLMMILCVSSGVFAEEAKGTKATGPKDTMVIEHAKKKKTAVTLNHKKHVDEYKNKCVDCHHNSKEADGKDAKACSTVDCHDGKKEHKLTKDIGKAKKGDVLDVASSKASNPYHANCLEDCHKTVNKEGKKSPTKCKECHPGGDDEKE